MSGWLTVLGAVGVISTLAALMGTGLALAREGRTGMALACLAGMAVIVFLTLVGLEYADNFWEGRT